MIHFAIVTFLSKSHKVTDSQATKTLKSKFDPYIPNTC